MKFTDRHWSVAPYVLTTEPMKLPKPKACSCGREFHEIPAGAKSAELGVYWNCVCNSTLFAKAESVRAA